MARILPRRGGITLDLDRGEPEGLSAVFADVRALVADGAPAPSPHGSTDPLEELVGPPSSPAPLPDDPAVARLFPDAYGDDAEASAEFRGLTRSSLRDGKLAALDSVIDDLHRVAPAGRLALSGDRAERWLAALNDVRLVIGSRLEIDEDIWERVEQMPEDDPRMPMLQLYDLLTVLQERLVHAVAGW